MTKECDNTKNEGQVELRIKEFLNINNHYLRQPLIYREITALKTPINSHLVDLSSKKNDPKKGH